MDKRQDRYAFQMLLKALNGRNKRVDGIFRYFIMWARSFVSRIFEYLHQKDKNCLIKHGAGGKVSV